MSRRTTFSFAWTCALAAALFLVFAGFLPAFAQATGSSTLSLATDSAGGAVHNVIHLTASLQTSGSSGTGSISFLDGTNPIASVPLNAQGIAVLGVASLTPGNHTLTATYAGDSTHASATSGTVAVAVTGVPVTLTSSASQSSVYANQPVTLTATGLPASATGSLSYLDHSTSLAMTAISGSVLAAYQAFGDGITSGQTVTSAQSYPSLFASADGFSITNLGVPNSLACDLLPYAILNKGLGPTQTSAPLSSVMIGTTDLDNYGGAYLPVFTSCDQAALAWLAIPREYKVLSSDPGTTVTSGSWNADPNTGTLQETSGAGTLTLGITSNGGPVYLWYLLSDALSGSFALDIDGVPGAASYSTQSTPAIGSLNHAPGMAFALLRLPLGAGPHALGVNVQSGTVGIFGAATPPSPGAASVHPTVLVSDIPNQLSTAPAAAPGLIAAYTQAIQSTVTQFQADGLDVRLIPTQQYMLGTAAEMSDSIDPNSLGQTHFTEAFGSIFGAEPTAPYAAFTGSTPTAAVAFSVPGTHSVIANYSGDSTYMTGSSPPISITVLPQTVSLTSLSTRTTSYPSGSPVVFTATVTPATASGTVTFYDGTALLSQAVLTGGAAVVTTETLALGLHSLSAVYSGDAPDAPSASPMLSVRITPGATSVILAPLTATAPYGALSSLTATLNPASAAGTITFNDSVNGTLGQVTSAEGSATLDASSLAVGTHTLTAFYAGDPSHLPGTSAAVTVTITALTTTTTLAAQPTQISFGAQTSLVATVSPATAGGSVIFRDALSGMVGTASIAAGSAVLNTSALSPGVRAISATYTGDVIHASSVSAISNVTVNVLPSAVVLAALPPSINTGSPVNLTATVSPVTATGTLTFRDPAAGVLGQATISHGVASLLLPSLPSGTYAITAVYPGDADDSACSSSAVSTQVVLQPSQIALAVAAASVPYSTALLISASVSPATAGGIVSFYDGPSPVGQASLVNGLAAFKIATLGTGAHHLHGVYGGDRVYATSTSAAVSALVTPAGTATTLTLAEAAVPLGSSVIFNVRVNTLPGSIPGGMVILRANGALLTSGPLANATAGVGYATLSISSAAIGFGTFLVTASYQGDGNNLPSDTSATPVSLAVVSSVTVTSLHLSSNQVPPQTPVTLAASVSNPSPVIATGSMEFSMNGAVLATVPLDASGLATTKLGAQPVGLYSLSARYLPSGIWAGSGSGPQTLTVTFPVALVLTPNTVSLPPGASTTVMLGLTPQSGFSGALQTQCTTSAPFITCTIDPVTSITGPLNNPVHLSVAQNTLGTLLPGPGTKLLQRTVFLAMLAPLYLWRRRSPKLRRRGLLALGTITLLSGCATGGDFGSIPPGRQLVVVTLTAAGTTTTAGVAVEVPK